MFSWVLKLELHLPPSTGGVELKQFLLRHFRTGGFIGLTGVAVQGVLGA